MFTLSLRSPMSTILKATSCTTTIISKLGMANNAIHTRQLLGQTLLTAAVRRQCTTSTKVNLDDVLIITNSCSKRIKQLQDKSNDRSLFLRISVQGGGCSGFQYSFDMDRSVTANDDRIFIKDGAQVVVDSGSYELIKGSTVDYAQEMIRSSFAVVNNPQAYVWLEAGLYCHAGKARTGLSSSTARQFQREKTDGDGEKHSIIGAAWEGIKRFLPKTSRVTLAENYDSPSPDPGHRYHLRLVDAKIADKRHIITRLRRYMPDLSWETAELIVHNSIEEGASLIRVFNSKYEVEYIVDMLRRADPPISVQLFDSKSQTALIT